MIFFSFVILGAVFFANPFSVQAKLQVNEGEGGTKIARSLESLRDIDSQTWQLAAYFNDYGNEKVILRVVGYPGTMRIEHPLPMRVKAGSRNWVLEDITLTNPKLARDSRQAAAEFELTPLLKELNNNRPLRLRLSGVFADLPIPPYLVSEWRTLLTLNSNK